MDEIDTREKLMTWLSGKPTYWAQSIGLRAALRSLPLVAPVGLQEREIVLRLSLAAFRACFISWAASRLPTLDLGHSLASASHEAKSLADYVAGAAVSSSDPAAYHRAGEVVYAAAASAAAAIAEDVGHSKFDAYSSAADAVARAHVAFPYGADGRGIWRAMNADAGRFKAGQSLFAEGLWPEGTPAWFSDAWDNFRNRLEGSGAYGWRPWMTWYRLRLEGSESSFGLPPEADAAVALRLVEQPASFWDRGWTSVNADLAGWLDEALTPYVEDQEPEPQNPISITFIIDDNGRIDLDAQAGRDEINADEEANDRYNNLQTAVDEAIPLCNNNSANSLYRNLVRYKESLGASISEIRPSLVIARGEALRQELRFYEREDPASFLSPIPEPVLLSVKEVVSGHNLMVGMDGALERRDLAILGPDVRRVQVNPQELKIVVDHGTRAGLLTPEARDALETVRLNAPSEPDVGDRRSRSLTEAARNLARKAFDAVWRQKKAILASAGTVLALHQIGGYLLRNEQTWLNWFADNPTMLATIRNLMDFLKTLPLS